MNLDQIIEIAKKGTNNVEYYEGIEAYTIPLVTRIVVAKSPIRQIINGKVVAKFHKKTGSLINEFISRRSEYGIEMKNLIRQEDKNLAIEISNSETLKETRLLPAGFKTDGIIATFGTYTTITSLNDEKPLGIIINDKEITETFNSIFDTLWEKGKRV